MAIASLTVDLVLGLARFEGDSTRAAGILERDAGRMTKAQGGFLASLERTSQRLAGTETDFLRVRAAELGVSDAAEKLLRTVDGVASSYRRVASDGAAAFVAITAGAEAAGTRQQAIVADLVAGIKAVNAEAARLRDTAVADEAAGKITPAQLRTRVGNADAGRADAVGQLKAAAGPELAAARAADAEEAASARFVASLQRQADAIGKTRVQLLAQEAAERGVSAQAAPLIARLAEAERGTGQLGKSVFATRNQLLTLKYTLSDVVASAASGISPLTILLQQGGQLAQVEGGLGGIFKTALSVITPFRVAAAGAAGAVAALGLAYFEGSKESRAFRDSQVLTNGAIGLTEGGFNALVKTIGAAAGATRGAAREIGQALANTGEIGPRSIRLATEAGITYAKATGQTADEVAKDFAGMSGGVAKWAAEHNKQLNFISVAQYSYIKALEESGQAEKARDVTLEALKTQLQGVNTNLGYIEASLKTGAHWWDVFWDSAKGVGRETTVEDRLDFIRKKIDTRAVTPALPGTEPFRARGDARLQAESNAVSREVLRGQENAFAQGERDVDEKRAIAAKDFTDKLREEARGIDVVTKKVAEAQRQFDALKGRQGLEVPAEEQARLLAFVRRNANPEADQARKAALQQALGALEKELQGERDALAFHQQFVEGVYQAGEISLRDYYAARREIAQRGAHAEVAAAETEAARLRAALKETTDPSDRIGLQRQIDEQTERAARARQQAARARVLSNAEEAASFKDLTDRVTEFHAQLQQLAGDEAGAAQTRAQQAIENARRFSVQSGGAVNAEDLDNFKRLTVIANEFAEAQRRVGLVTADATRAEEMLGLRAEAAGRGLIDQERAVYTLRAAALVQLGAERDKLVALASASDDPRIKQAAADAQLAWEKAARAVDPALNRLRDANQSLAQSITDDIGSAINEFKSLNDVARAVSQDIQRYLTKLFITDPLKQSLQGLISSITEGGGPVGDFFKSTLKIGQGTGDAITKKAADALLLTATQQQTAALGEQILVQTAAKQSVSELTVAAYSAARALEAVAASGGGSSLGGLGGFFASTGASGTGLEGLSPEDLSYFFGGHGGGVAGYFGSPIKARASDFSGAPRYHSGGVVGLQPDEVASILRRGEEVITRDDPRHRWNSGKGGGGAASMPVYLSINNNGAPVETKSKTATQTDRGLLVELVIDTIKNDADNGGPATRAIAGRLGGNTAAGVPRRGRAGF